MPVTRRKWGSCGYIIEVLKTSRAKAIFTDVQFWLPVAILLLGFGLLLTVR